MPRRQRRHGDIQHVGNIGGYRYLHYWFADSGLQIQDYSAAKQQVLKQQLSLFKARQTGIVVSGEALAGLELLNDVTDGNEIGKHLESDISEIFHQQGVPTAAAPSGIGNMSFAQVGLVGSQGVGAAAALAKECAMDLDAAFESANNAIKDIIAMFAASYPKAVEVALAAAMNYQESVTTQQFLNDVLTSGKHFIKTSNMGSLKAGEQQIAQTVARLQAQVNAISMIGSKDYKVKEVSFSSSGKSGRTAIGSRNQLLAVLLGKIGGNLSAAAGLAGKIAAARGAEKALVEGAKQQTEIKMGLSGDMKVTIDPALVSLANTTLQNYSFNKENASVILTRDNVLVDFGLTVKTSKANKGKAGQPVSVNLQNTSSLSAILAKVQGAGVSERYIMNLAGGVQEGSEGSLQQGWKSLVDYAVVLNFLDFLTGKNGIGGGELALVYNQRIIPFKDILSGIANVPDAITYTGGKQRAAFWQINYNNWYGPKRRDLLSAEQRSNQTWGEIQGAFAATSVTAKLNLTALGLI